MFMNPEFELLQDGLCIRRELSKVIAGATKSLCIMMYIFCNDKAGNAVLSELIAALQRGVRVRIILDGFGSMLTPHRFFSPFYQAGGQIQKFNTHWHPRYLFRNHQKFVIADGQTALTGGFNIADHYFGDGINSGWRDIGIRIDGPPVKELQDYFDMRWQAPTRHFRKLHRTRSHEKYPARHVEWLFSGPGIGRSNYAINLKKDLSRATRLSLMMGYFVPPISLRRALGKIARRGEARLVLPALTDVPISRLAAWHTFARLLRDGCEIYEYQPRPLHAKLIVLDDVVYVGSSNLDIRSLHLNFEMTLRVRDAALAAQALQLIQNDIRLSVQITEEAYQKNMGLWQRIVRKASYMFLNRFDYIISRKFVE
jgi:cardiolipin synthase